MATPGQAPELKTGKRAFNHYDPHFIYRYRAPANLTVRNVVEVGSYIERAEAFGEARCTVDRLMRSPGDQRRRTGGQSRLVAKGESCSLIRHGRLVRVSSKELGAVEKYDDLLESHSVCVFEANRDLCNIGQ